MDEAAIVRRKIDKNLTTIKHTLSKDIDSIIERLVIKGVITSKNKGVICSQKIAIKRVDEVLGIIKKGGMKAFNVFMDILAKHNHRDLIDTINTTAIDPEEKSDSSQNVLKMQNEMKHEIKKGFEEQEEKIKDGFKKSEKKMKEQFRESEEKMSEKLREKGKERDLLLTENKKMAAELSFLREEITSLKKEVEEEDAEYKQQLNVVLDKYEKVCKENALIHDLDNENKTLKKKIESLDIEIKSLKASLSKLRGTVKARYAPVNILPPIVRKSAE